MTNATVMKSKSIQSKNTFFSIWFKNVRKLKHLNQEVQKGSKQLFHVAD